MNQLIATLNKQRISVMANEARLLKKLIFASIILILASQPAELGSIVHQAMVDAYLQVSVFVGLTLLVFIGLDSLSNFNIEKFLLKSKPVHVPLASFLGAIPGCGGAVIVVTQYIQGRIGFGSLVAVLTATMGDAAFLLLAIEPKTGFLIFFIGLSVGIFSGYAVDYIHRKKFIIKSFKNSSSKKNQEEKIKNTFVSKFNFLWLVIFVPGFLLGIVVAFQLNPDLIIELPLGLSLTSIIGISGAILSLLMWSLNPLSDFQLSTDKKRGYIPRVVDTTNFVTTWVIAGFLIFELFMFFTNIDLKAIFDVWLPIVPMIAILFGFLPGCGPQIVVATFYLNGFIPLSAEIGNAISNDGDALFPALALAPKAAILATLYSAIPAILVAYSYMFIFE
tara:strand:+ start:898 stop:2073 length:1176 start_codon:yes stop_codon:yes gene_type:complete